MPQLHAPWRMEYIGGPQPPGCLFCRVQDAPAEQDADNLVIHRAPLAVVMLNRFPYTSGHLLIAPRAHVPSLVDLDDETSLELMRLARRALRAFAPVLGPDGCNVGVNIGKVAGAGIPDHVHLHLVPRWNGDTNFMPVLADVTIINEHLQRTWEKLKAAFDEVA
jgi:ATP adenylyltransferase